MIKKLGVLAVLVMVMAGSLGMTVKAMSEQKPKITKEQYKAMEAEYLQEVRMILLEKGCKNAGVTLTHVTDEEGNRTYTITVHHRKLEKIQEEEISLLKERVSEIPLEINTSKVDWKFL